MKRAVIGLLAAFAVAAVTSGCASFCGDNNSAEAAYKKFKSERPDAKFEPCGDASVDSTAALSGKVYGATVKYLDDYVAATDGHSVLVGFANEVQDEMDTNKKSKAEAEKIVIARVKEEDAKKADAKKVYPELKKAQKAVEALDPQARLLELGKLEPEATAVAATASKLPGSFSGFDAATLKKSQTAKKVATQAQYTVEAIGFLKKQYNIVQDLKSYMQDK